MSAAANLDWLYTILSWVLASAGIGLLLLALFYNRPRGRRRCPKCWYDMAATPGLTCPECGRTARSERKLFKTRRHWRLTILSLPLFAAAYFCHFWPLIKSGGWLAPIPTRILLEIYPLTGPNTKFGDELLDRTSLRTTSGKRSGTPTQEQLIFLITRAAHGNLLARPTDSRWRRTYGQLLKLVSNRGQIQPPGPYTYPGALTITSALAPAIQAWADVPAAPQVHTRSHWLRGLPITIDGTPETWWPMWFTDNEEITWSANGGQAKGVNKFRMNCPIKIDLTGHVIVEGTIKVLQEEIKEGLSDGRRPQREMAAAPFRFEYDVVDSIDEIMQPVGSPEFDAFLASSLTVVMTQYSIANLSISKPLPPGYDDAVFAATLEVLAGDRILMTAHIRGSSLSRILAGVYSYGEVNTADNDPDADKLGRGEIDPSWRVRIRTDPQWALSDLEGERYWKGEFVAPIAAGKVSR